MWCFVQGKNIKLFWTDSIERMACALWNGSFEKKQKKTNEMQWGVGWKTNRRSLMVSGGGQRGREKENTRGKGERPRRTDKDGWRGRAAGRPPSSPVMDDRPVTPLITWQDACKTLRKYFLSRFVGNAAKVPGALPLYGSEEDVKSSSALLQTSARLHVPAQCATRERRDHFRAKLRNNRPTLLRHVSGGLLCFLGESKMLLQVLQN